MTRLLRLALALALAACAAPAAAAPPVWVVRDADSEMVLFGSVHVLPPGLPWRPAALDAALAQAEDVWFELPVGPAAQAEAGRLSLELGQLPPGHSLYAHLSPEGAARLDAAARRLNLSPALLDRLEPWLAEVALAAALYAAEGASAAAGVEQTLNAAVPPGADVRAFETIEEQIAIFDQAPLAEQVASLEHSLEEIEREPDAFADLLSRWTRGDLAGIEAEVLSPLRAAAPGLYARLVADRNQRWTTTLDARLKGRGRTVVVVGVGHLIGSDGLPERLRALGYAVEGP